MRGRAADGGAGGPEDRPGIPSDPHRFRSTLARAAVEGRGGVLAVWLGWIRAQPVLAGAFLAFCVVAVGGLLLSLPYGTLSVGRASRSAAGARTSAPTPRVRVAPPETPAPAAPHSPTDEAPSAEPGPWVEKAPSPASARGLALVYRYRTLPPGGESQYEWMVQVRGAPLILDAIDVVTWQMEPPAKNGADFISRDRAADGFPLFGHGPGGWFGVSARIRYRDGEEETLTRRIDLSD